MESGALFNNPTGLIAGILIVATLAAMPLSYLILRRYSAAVGRTMREAGTPIEATPTAATSESPPPLKLDYLQANRPINSSSLTAVLLEYLYTEPRRLSAAYALAGAIYALLGTLILLPANDIPYSGLRIIAVSFVFLWPVVPQIVCVAVAHRALKIAGPIIFLVLALLLGLFIGKATVIAILLLWTGVMLIPTLTQLAITNRLIRNVGPFVTGFFAVLLLAVFCTLALILAVGIPANGFVLLLIVAGLVGAVLAARGLVGWIARAYQAKRMSDQMLLIDAWWLIYTSWLCVFLTVSMAWWGVILGVIPFIGARAALLVALRVRKSKRPERQPVRLLLLRVFGFRQRTEHLLEQIGHHWRHIGSIELIAAPDVAQTALEPHELLDYAGGRISRSFIKDEHELEKRLSGIDCRPDPDGRYRVNELFCQEHTWKPALRRLASTSHVVLMDLRGFSPEHRGCIYEISQLVDIVPASRVLLVIDQTTNQAFLENKLRRAWQQMRADSPNRDPEHGTLRILRLTDEGPAAVRSLISELCRSASL